MTSAGAVTVVTITIARDGDLYHAYSDDIAGLYLTSRDSESLENDVAVACKYLYKKNHYVEIQVSPVADKLSFPESVLVKGKLALSQVL